MMKALLCAFVVLFGMASANAQPVTTTVPGTLLNNPLTLPNPTLFTGAAATINANGQGTVGASSTLGAVIQGQGSTNDVTINNKSGSAICKTATGATTLNCTALAIGGTAETFPASGLLVGTTDTQTLTNKTISSASNTLTLTTATNTSGITSGDLLSSSSNKIADSGVPSPGAPDAANGTYSYPYGAGNGGCFSGWTCTIPTGQTAPSNSYKGTASNGLAYLWDSNRWVNNNSVFAIHVSTNPLGGEDGNSSIPSQTINGKTFSLRFSSSGITGSPITITYTGTGSDTTATVATNLCNAVIANANLSDPTTGLPVICDANQGGGGFNLQWSVLVNPMTVTSVGTGTITLASTENNLDGVFQYFVRTIPGYSFAAGDLIWCDEYDTHQLCGHVIEDVAATGLADELTLDMGTASGLARTMSWSEGTILNCATNGGPNYAGIGTLNVCNSANGGSLYFANSSGVPDARIFENSGTAMNIQLGTGNTFAIDNNAGSATVLDYGATNSGAWTVNQPLFLTGLGTGTATKYVCGTSANQIIMQSSPC